MRIKLLIATGDGAYAEHLSNHISEYHADAIEVVVCRTAERLQELLKTASFDAALLDGLITGDDDLSSIHLPLLLWSEEENAAAVSGGIGKMRKYQRISSIVADVLERYAQVSASTHGDDSERAVITAVWSPAGGVGKTTVALAFAAKKLAEGKQALYLDLEPFSSVPAYFPETGKSISAVFEMLENNEGDIKTLIRGIRRHDSAVGIAYFCRPDNFDDMNILSAEDVSALIDACAGVTEELVIDMSCVCDARARKIFEMANRVLIVTDQSSTARIKLSQFASQHNIFPRIKVKTTLVANKGAVFEKSLIDSVVRLPLVQTSDEDAVYKTLSYSNFEA